MTHNQTDLDLSVRAYDAHAEGDSAVGVLELAHQDVRDLLSDFLDGSLSPSEAERVRQHLNGCTPCRAFYRTLVQTARLANELPSPRLPDSVKRRIVDRLKAATAQS